jgi:hypothetical protein
MLFVSFFFLRGVTLYMFPGLLICLRDREAPLLSYLHYLEIVRNVGNVVSEPSHLHLGASFCMPTLTPYSLGSLFL